MQFLDGIRLPTKPKGFTVEAEDPYPNLRGTVIRKPHDGKADPVKLQKSIWKACTDLLDWAEKLPVNEERY